MYSLSGNCSRFYEFYALSPPRNPYSRERISTNDLCEHTSLEQFLSPLKINISFFYQTSYLNVEVNCTVLSLSLRVPCLLVLSSPASSISHFIIPIFLFGGWAPQLFPSSTLSRMAKLPRLFFHFYIKCFLSPEAYFIKLIVFVTYK
jgi:hypothetical protein